MAVFEVETVGSHVNIVLLSLVFNQCIEAAIFGCTKSFAGLLLVDTYTHMHSFK